MNNEKINSKIKPSKISSFVILIFLILKFRNIDRSTFRRSKFWPPPKFPIIFSPCTSLATVWVYSINTVYCERVIMIQWWNIYGILYITNIISLKKGHNQPRFFVFFCNPFQSLYKMDEFRIGCVVMHTKCSWLKLSLPAGIIRESR